MKYQTNDIVSIWVDDFLDRDYGHWLGVVTKCNQDYYRIKWLIMAKADSYELEDTYRVEACNDHTSMRLHHRNP